MDGRFWLAILVIFGVFGFLVILAEEGMKKQQTEINRTAFVIGCTWTDNSKGQQELCKSRAAKNYP